MTYGILYEKVSEPGFAGMYYAHIPTLGLTTHGEGIEGARRAAEDLVLLWLQEKLAEGELTRQPEDILFSTIEISENALQGS